MSDDHCIVFPESDDDRPMTVDQAVMHFRSLLENGVREMDEGSILAVTILTHPKGADGE